MKFTAISTLAAVAAISISAHAATGMPSKQETGIQHAGEPAAGSVVAHDPVSRRADSVT